MDLSRSLTAIATGTIVVGVMLLVIGILFTGGYAKVTVAEGKPQWLGDVFASGPLHVILGIMMIFLGIVSAVRPAGVFRSKTVKEKKEGV